MKPQLWYRIDQRLVGALCHWVGKFVPTKSLVPDPIERVVVAKYLGIGSLLLATPLMQLIRRHHPNAQLAIATSRSLAEMAHLLPVQKVFVWDLSDWASALRTFPRFVAQLRSWRPQAFFDLEFFVNASALVAWLSGAPVRVGFHHAQSPRGRLLTHYLPVTPRHVTQLFAGLAWCLGMDISELPPLWRPNYDPQRASETVQQLPRPFVVINPNAGELALQRRWLPERFHELLCRLLDTFPDLHFALIGTTKERPVVMQVLGDLQGHPRVHNLAGKLSLIDLCFLLDNAVAVITNDSGPLHIATAFGTPCVALFGPETPAHYGPMGEQHRVLYKALPCSPCLTPFDGKQFPCPFSVRCLREIRVDEVVEAATEVIAKRLTVPVAS